MILTRENLNNWRKTCPIATFPHKPDTERLGIEKGASRRKKSD
jgi:hypothetical protein